MPKRIPLWIVLLVVFGLSALCFPTAWHLKTKSEPRVEGNREVTLSLYEGQMLIGETPYKVQIHDEWREDLRLYERTVQIFSVYPTDDVPYIAGHSYGSRGGWEQVSPNSASLEVLNRAVNFVCDENHLVRKYVRDTDHASQVLILDRQLSARTLPR